MPEFVDRTEELARLRELYDSTESELAVIYGRRRLGKTELVKHSVRERDDDLIYGSLLWGDRSNPPTSFSPGRHYQIPMSQQRGDRIVTDLMEVPHFKGTRVDVLTIHDAVEERGLDPHLVAEQHNLRPADVFHALAYYYDHPKEMHELQQARADRDAEFKRNAAEQRPEGIQN